eukprot:6220318-Pyramimonas_sp.AAC.1
MNRQLHSAAQAQATLQQQIFAAQMGQQVHFDSRAATAQQAEAAQSAVAAQIAAAQEAVAQAASKAKAPPSAVPT